MWGSKHSMTEVFIDYPSRYYRRYLPQGKPFQIKIDTGNLLLWSSLNGKVREAFGVQWVFNRAKRKLNNFT